MAHKTNTYANVSVLKRIANAIAIRPRSQYEIIELTGLTNSTVSRWLRFLNTSTKESKAIVYIERYERRSPRGNPTALWAWGFDVPNAIKPPPPTNAEHLRNYRKRKNLKPSVTQTDKGIIHVSR